MQNIWRDHYEFGDLPLWRKALLVCVVVLFFAVGGRLFNLEAGIYSSAPSAPLPQEGKVYPVQVNHGYLRYVAEQESERLEFWRATTPPILVVLIGIAGLTLVTYRRKH